MPESKSGALPLGDIPISKRGPATGHSSIIARSCAFCNRIFYFSCRNYRHKRLKIEKYIRKRTKPKLGSLCSRYLFSRPVTRQLSSAYVCLTSVFGMGTGGPTRQSTQTLFDGFNRLYISNALALDNLGDPYRIRTDVNGVRGRCLNHWTNGPFGAPSGTRTRDPLIKSQLLYQLS